MNEEEFMEEVIGRYVEKNTTHIKGYTKEYVDNLLQEKDKEIENLTHIVANKIIEDYDIDTPLKNQLNEERIKYINLGVVCNDYKSRCEKANTLLDEMLERAYIDGQYIMYDYSTSELLEVKQALKGEDKDE